MLGAHLESEQGIPAKLGDALPTPEEQALKTSTPFLNLISTWSILVGGGIAAIGFFFLARTRVAMGLTRLDSIGFKRAADLFYNRSGNITSRSSTAADKRDMTRTAGSITTFFYQEWRKAATVIGWGITIAGGGFLGWLFDTSGLEKSATKIVTSIENGLTHINDYAHIYLTVGISFYALLIYSIFKGR